MHDALAEKQVPLCVDMDGTLLKVDSLHESLILLLKKHPMKVVAFVCWALRGKGYAKSRLADCVLPDPEHLPFCSEVLAFLRAEHAKGRPIVLVTAADQRLAERVAAHVGLFHDVLGSSATSNLGGKAKAKVLEKKFGKRGFDYIGNAVPDLHVWAVARKAILADATHRFAERVGRIAVVDRIFPRAAARSLALLRGMRPHQWLKNILIFIPLLTAHLLSDALLLERAFVAFVLFCATTSGVYLCNDVLDLAADRAHPRKRRRPVASGDLPIATAVMAAALLMLLGVLGATLLSASFVVVLLCYIVATFTYSFVLKQVVIVDVIVLAALYTVRIIAGHSATGVAYSVWLLLFSMFFFFSLALVKRASELQMVAEEKKKSVAGRGYTTDDLSQITMLGVASGYLSILVLALYITTEDVTRLYRLPQGLLFLIPLMLYWISRLWLLARRGAVHEDPIIFAMRDRTSYVVGILMALILFFAT